MLGSINTIIIAHKDRFIRFGYDWFERFFMFSVVEYMDCVNIKIKY